MAGYLGRHQQLVRSCRRLARLLLPATIALALMGATALAMRGGGAGPRPSAAGGEGDEPAAEYPDGTRGQGIPLVERGADESAADEQEEDATGGASLDTFDDALERGRAAGENPATVSWEEDRDLVGAASALLDAYRAQGLSELATSGYVDLAGDVWGALLVDARGWVDMVTVTGAADDATARVQVVRFWAEDDAAS